MRFDLAIGNGEVRQSDDRMIERLSAKNGKGADRSAPCFTRALLPDPNGDPEPVADAFVRVEQDHAIGDDDAHPAIGEPRQARVASRWKRMHLLLQSGRQCAVLTQVLLETRRKGFALGESWRQALRVPLKTTVDVASLVAVKDLEASVDSDARVFATAMRVLVRLLGVPGAHEQPGKHESGDENAFHTAVILASLGRRYKQQVGMYQSV
jgi:hypothetical protein